MHKLTQKERLSPLERVSLTLQHKEPDRVPVYPLLNGISRRLVNASYKEWSTDAGIAAKAYCKVTEEFNLDVIVTLLDLSVEAADFGQKLIFPENEAPHPDYSDPLIKDLEGYYQLEPVNPRKTFRMGHILNCDKR